MTSYTIMAIDRFPNQLNDRSENISELEKVFFVYHLPRIPPMKRSWKESHLWNFDEGGIVRSSWNIVLACLATISLLLVIGCGPDENDIWVSGYARIRGFVSHPDDPSTPLAQASVRLEQIVRYDDPGNIVNRIKSTYTDKDGNYEILDIEPGMYDLVVDRTLNNIDYRYRLRFIELKAGAIINLIDIQPKPAASFSGTVTLRGAGAFNPSFPDNSNIEVLVPGTTIHASTDASGAYTLSPVEETLAMPALGQIASAATYEIHFHHSGYGDKCVTGISAIGGTNTMIDPVELLPLNPSSTGSLTGRAVLEAARNDSNADIRVTVDGTTRTLVTTSGGYYRFDGLPTGTYTLRFEHDDYFDQLLSEARVTAGVPVNTMSDVKLSNHRPINEQVRAFDLALSPSGHQLAYITSDNVQGGEIGLMHPGGQAFNQVITEGAHAVGGRGLTWSENETEILFVRYIGDPLNAYTIAVTDNTGSETRNLLANGTDYFGVSWAPDLKKFAYYLTGNLYSVEVDRSQGYTEAVTSTTTVIAPIGTVTRWRGMEWANTGRIVYCATILGLSDLFTVYPNGAGGGVSQAVNPTLEDGTSLIEPFTSPSFSPDYGRIAFSVDPDSTSPEGIYVCDIDGVDAVRLTEEAGTHLTWDAPGDRIFYIDGNNRIAELKVPSALR